MWNTSSELARGILPHIWGKEPKSAVKNICHQKLLQLQIKIWDWKTRGNRRCHHSVAHLRQHALLFEEKQLWKVWGYLRSCWPDASDTYPRIYHDGNLHDYYLYYSLSLLVLRAAPRPKKCVIWANSTGLSTFSIGVSKQSCLWSYTVHAWEPMFNLSHWLWANGYRNPACLWWSPLFPHQMPRRLDQKWPESMSTV